MKTVNIILKKNFKYSLIMSVLCLASCSDSYLNVTPSGTSVDESFYKTVTDANQALNAAYSPMRETYGAENFNATMGNDIVLGDIGTDDFTKGGVSLSNTPELLQKDTYTLQATNQYIEAIWNVNYKGILYANLVLDKVPSITFTNQVDKNQILAEAYFLRAYYYFNLVRYFGGVPLIDKPLSFGNYNVPRATKEQIYAFIENDLKTAIPNLASRFNMPATFLGHADKGAALGLMMRVSLYENKMDQVKTYGEQLFLLPYVLAPTYSTIFNSVGEWNTESIFEIDFSSNASVLGNGLVKRIQPQSKKGGGFLQVKDGLRNEFELNDPRYAASFYFVAVPYGTGWFNKKYSWAPYSDYAFPTIGGNGQSSANNIRVIRLADAYLMYAEAVYLTAPQTAVAYVNLVRKRARGTLALTVLPPLPLTLNGTALRDAIYHERRVELAGEGYRYQDLIRTGRASTILGPLGFVVGKNEVMPIPYSQIVLAQGVLTQNNY